MTPESPGNPGNPRERLAARQAELLRALLAGGPPPPGFDSARLAVESTVLRAKRRGIVARLRPDVPAALGESFGPLFDEYAAENPRAEGVRARQDADMFADWLVAHGKHAGFSPRRKPLSRLLSPLRRIASR
ncbi:hypothetical protein [Amycolatopsis pigmentata]|uniref:SCO6045-like C-terminal domain-containing protein n=1 Tax=Amycolatopsis pigmentata TaxID=450801 RepID=A0ABW5FVS8_9PSEU